VDGTAAGSAAGSAEGAPAASTPADPAGGAAAAGGGTVIVHVAGAVGSPGVVELPQGARVRDAVAAAGGARADADLAAVNLARPLADGEQVYIPVPGETPPAAAGGGAAAGAAGSAGAAGAGGVGAPSGPLNLNTADAAALDTLPGIGPVLAERIVAYRTQHGPFPDVPALTDVPGIGPAILESVAELVTVG
jgi:competence protein ComEA